MAEAPIEQPIQITGDSEILRVLKSIGDAGRDAFSTINKAAKGVESSAANAEGGLKKIEDASKDLGRSLRLVYDGSVQVAKSLAALGAAAAAATTALVALTKSAARNAEEARDQAAVLGITTEEYGKLSYALKQSSGDMGTARQALFRLSTMIKEANEGNAESVEKFRKLGVSVKGSNGQLRSTTDILGDIAERFKSMPNDARKLALAIDLFGQRAGPKLIPFLNEGRAGLVALGEEAKKLGIVFDKSGADLGKKFSDSLTKLGGAFEGLVNEIGLAFFPVFTEIADGFADFITEFREPVRAIATAIAGAIQAVVTAFKTYLLPVLKEAFNLLDQIIKQINAAFGTNLSAKVILVSIAIAGLGAIAVKVIAALAAMIPGLTTLLKIFTGLPGAIGAFVGAAKIAVGAIGALVNAIRIGLLVFGGWPAIILAVAAAIGFLLYKYLNSGLWQQHLEAIKGFFNSAWETIKAGWTTVAGWFESGWATITGIFSNGVETIKSIFNNIWEGIKTRWNDFITGINNAWESIKSKVMETWNAIVTFVLEKINIIKKALDGLFGGEGKAVGGPAIGAAGGGHIRGPGTSTSDSIPAWLSNNEFVHRAAAVRKYGLSFMRSINNLTFDPYRFADAFSMGGLVSPAPVLKLADGGSAGPRNILNLSLDGETFEGLSAPDDTFDRLRKKAIKRSLSPRKPNWYK